MSTELNQSRLTTASLASAAAMPATQREVVLDPNEAAIHLPSADPTSEVVTLAALFLPEVATGFRSAGMRCRAVLWMTRERRCGKGTNLSRRS